MQEQLHDLELLLSATIALALTVIGGGASILAALAILFRRFDYLRRTMRETQTQMAETRTELTQADARTDHRVDTVWQSSANRGKVCAVTKGVVAPVHSPPSEKEVITMSATSFDVRPDVRKAYQHILPAIRALLHDLLQQHQILTDGQWAEALATHYDDWLLIHICAPLKLTRGECYYAARVLAAEPAAAADTHDDLETPIGKP